MFNTTDEYPFNVYKVEVFTRFSKKIDIATVAGRLRFNAENPIVESIAVDDLQVLSTSLHHVAGKAEVSLELNQPVTEHELAAICADICQRAMHRRIEAILPWQDRHNRTTSH